MGNLTFQNFEVFSVAAAAVVGEGQHLAAASRNHSYFHFHVSYHKIYIKLDIVTAAESPPSVSFTSVLCSCLSSVLVPIDRASFVSLGA